MRATEKLPLDLDSMSDHFALAMLANRSHRLNRAFETIEGMPCSSRLDCECLVVFIAADFALRHRTSSRMCLPPSRMNDRRLIKSLCLYAATCFRLEISATVTSLIFKYILHVGVLVSEAELMLLQQWTRLLLGCDFAALG
jgi:hypothetical protein